MTLATLETDVLNIFSAIKTGGQVLLADVESIIAAIIQDVETVGTALANVTPIIENDILPVAEAIGLSLPDANIIEAALATATTIVANLKTVATAVQTGTSDLTALTSGAASVQQASALVSNLAAQVLTVKTTAQTLTVSPPTPNEG